MTSKHRRKKGSERRISGKENAEQVRKQTGDVETNGGENGNDTELGRSKERDDLRIIG